MQFEDDTPDPESTPEVYPRNPPINLLYDPALLRPRNLFAFEGIDGAGKSTLLREVSKRCAARGLDVICLKLTGSDLVRHALERAKWLNVDPMSFNLLSWVSLFHQTSLLRDVFNTERVVLFDRYTMTIKVRGVLEGLETDYMGIVERLIPSPAATFLIDCEPSICAARIQAGQRRITYFETGARQVPTAGARIIESDPLERVSNPEREVKLLKSLIRIREEYRRLLPTYSNAHVIENCGDISTCADRVLRHLT